MSIPVYHTIYPLLRYPYMVLGTSMTQAQQKLAFFQTIGFAVLEFSMRFLVLALLVLILFHYLYNKDFRFDY